MSESVPESVRTATCWPALVETVLAVGVGRSISAAGTQKPSSSEQCERLILSVVTVFRYDRNTYAVVPVLTHNRQYENPYVCVERGKRYMSVHRTPGRQMGSRVVDVDPERVRQVLGQHPVRLAVLFGSQTRGTPTAESDVDVAVAFEAGLSPAERLEHRVSLIVDLVETLGTDDVDVADLDAIRPAVGASALRSGTVLLGDRELIEMYHERFERATVNDETHGDRMRRFDALLERLEGRV